MTEALTGLSCVGASTTVGNAADPPRATFPRLAEPALPGFCNVRSLPMNEQRGTRNAPRSLHRVVLRHSLGE